jgi:hypothetical protein
MPDTKKYDLDFRPKGYWGPQELEMFIGARVKGELRRQQAISDLKENHADEDIIAESLREEHRSAVGVVHPWLMGGEYLPDLHEGEVEICRTVLKSVTMDVTSVRAGHDDNKIVYRVVDEYGDYEYGLKYKTSSQPLTMGQLIENIDTCTLKDRDTGEENDYGGGGLIRPSLFQQFEFGEEPEKISDFVTIHSAFYPHLEDYYENQKLIWIKGYFSET